VIEGDDGELYDPTPEPDKGRYLSQTQLAKRWPLKRGGIDYYIKTGRIRTEMVAGRKLIPIEEVLRIEVENGFPTKHPKTKPLELEPRLGVVAESGRGGIAE